MKTFIGVFIVIVALMVAASDSPYFPWANLAAVIVAMTGCASLNARARR